MLALSAALPATRAGAASVIPEESYCEFDCALPALDDPAGMNRGQPLLPLGGFETNPFQKFIPLQHFIRSIETHPPAAAPQDAGGPTN